jgi:hypothetical protein
VEGVKVRTLYECGTYMKGEDAVITGGICFSIPFRQDVEHWVDDEGFYHEIIDIELVNVHFYNGTVLAIPKSDFDKVVTVTNNPQHSGS